MNTVTIIGNVIRVDQPRHAEIPDTGAKSLACNFGLADDSGDRERRLRLNVVQFVNPDEKLDLQVGDTVRVVGRLRAGKDWSDPQTGEVRPGRVEIIATQVDTLMRREAPLTVVPEPAEESQNLVGVA